MSYYALLANLILLIHFALVVFNVGGLLVVWLGYFRGWSFTRNFWFRFIHLVSMAIVAFQALGGLFCPLTVWEDRLRRLAGEEQTYNGSFIAYWFHKIMFFDLPWWTFTIAYVTFFVLVALTFVLVPPRRSK